MQHSPSEISLIPPCRRPGNRLFIAGLLAAMAMGAGMPAWAQTAGQAVPGTAAGANSGTRASAAATASTQPNAAPRYSASEIDRAFSYIDANRDGKISREEASGFRGVARHFDEADTNKDNSLSLEEFSAALNASKKS
jgi:hypothetical protein